MPDGMPDGMSWRQVYDGVSAPDPDDPVEHLCGAESLTEMLWDCSFTVKPGVGHDARDDASVGGGARD